MEEGGLIIPVDSPNEERISFPGGSVYARSKASIVLIKKGLARDFGPRKITVKNFEPGPIDTDKNWRSPGRASLQIGGGYAA